jgi:uncharacterized OB-fold protein
MMADSQAERSARNRAKRLAAGKCVRCGGRKGKTRTVCVACNEAAKARVKARRAVAASVAVRKEKADA